MPLEYVVVPISALLVATLTLISGFGLGTVLLPAFLVFFGPEVAVAATAVVHLANNVFKLGLIGRNADRKVLLRFAPTAILAAFAGAWLLSAMSETPPFASWSAWGRTFEISLVKIALAIVMAAFAVLELIPGFEKWSLDPKWLPVGGLVSGFFGGLSGHQGALRSAFLLRAGLEKQAFVATGAVIAVFVDVARLGVYGVSFASGHEGRELLENAPLLAISCVAAFLGSYVGAKLVDKVTIETVRRIVGVCLMFLAIAIAAGLV